MKRIGSTFYYTTSYGATRFARCVGFEFHQGLGKWVYIGISPFGNRVVLSKDEVVFRQRKKRHS